MSDTPFKTKILCLTAPLALVFGFFSSTAGAETVVEFKSTDAQIHLVELFSSEGCSSCPPADAWLATLRNQPGLWKQFVPVEFHVDYWNRLGWTDRFSKTAFTERQQSYAREWANGNVYTPGFVLDGKEWRASDAGALSAAGASSAGVLTAKKTGPRGFEVTYQPPAGGPPAEVRVFGALLGNGLESKVVSGENNGSTLRHEFVVLSFANTKLDKKGQSFAGALEFKEPTTASARSSSVAFWVTDGKSQKPIQAVGGDL